MGLFFNSFKITSISFPELIWIPNFFIQFPMTEFFVSKPPQKKQVFCIVPTTIPSRGISTN